MGGSLCDDPETTLTFLSGDSNEIPIKMSSPFSPSPHSACTAPPFASCPRPFFARSLAVHRLSLPLQGKKNEWKSEEQNLKRSVNRAQTVLLLLSTFGSRSSMTSFFFWRSDWASWSFSLQQSQHLQLTSQAKPTMAAFWLQANLIKSD